MISCSALQQFSMAPFTVMVLSGLYRVRSWSLAGEQGNVKQWAMQDWDQVPTRDKQGQKNQLSYRASISKGCLTYLQPQVARARTGQPRTKPVTGVVPRHAGWLQVAPCALLQKRHPTNRLVSLKG